MTGSAERPEHALAAGFADHVVRWARACSAPASSLSALRAAAYAVSFATASGDVCTLLADVAAAIGEQDVSALRAALLGSGVVGAPEAPAVQPLIIDADGRVYLHRYFDYERRLAQRVREWQAAAIDAAGDAMRARLDELFAANAAQLGERPDWQKLATALALERALTIVSGGPGTGKTTTVVNMLACLIARDPDCRIALAAPTGKAAARMQDAVRNAAARLPAEVVARLPSEAFTLHRLLGAGARSGEFRHHAANPLALDVLVVDEASMLDLALATKLFEALPRTARLILLGDKDQLAAVEAGALFAELCDDPTLTPACIERLAALTGISAERIAWPSPLRPTGITDSVVWLTENFRFATDSGIGRLAACINAGDGDAAIALLRARTDPALAWIEDADAVPQPATRERILERLAPYVAALRADPGDMPALFQALNRFRVLCAQREGARGVVAVNALASAHVRRVVDDPSDPGAGSAWYPGRPVMVVANDYVQKLWNGDVGIALPDADGGLSVHFPQSDGGYRAVPPFRLPEHETAFATTVHKAQGSEFDEVLLLLPAKPGRVVSRELLYTAVTRARAAVTIVGSEETLATGIASPTRRYSGLVARLQAVAARDSTR